MTVFNGICRGFNLAIILGSILIILRALRNLRIQNRATDLMAKGSPYAWIEVDGVYLQPRHIGESVVYIAPHMEESEAPLGDKGEISSYGWNAEGSYVFVRFKGSTGARVDASRLRWWLTMRGVRKY